ncbi:sentrin-specific protease 2-like [Pogoniulus pusillus]|uniref:sentrin-specific protease 2-like n=1 Tax=Pogoniulus pusillus TaxID=488313 RepID=UPI0030B9452A
MLRECTGIDINCADVRSPQQSRRSDTISTGRNGKHSAKHLPDGSLTLRPPMKERAVPESVTPEATKTRKVHCTAAEDVQRGEKVKYRQLLQLVKEKCAGIHPPPQLTSHPVVSWVQADPSGKHGAQRSEEAVHQLHLAPLLPRKSAGLEAEESKVPGVEKPSEGSSVLTEALEKEVCDAFGRGDPDEIVSSAFKLKVTREDIGTLREHRWLNDEVINFYMKLIAERSKKEGFAAVHAFSTFFYPKFISGGYSAVRKWTKGVDLFQQDLIFVPIHLRVHWALVVVDVRRKTIRYYDSMAKSGDKICQTLFQYLREESLEKRNLELASSEWTLRSMESHEIPQQSNGSDCGVFMCKYAEYISRDRATTFTQNDMPAFRKTMVWEIIHQQLL